MPAETDDLVVFAMDGATSLAHGIESWIAEQWIPGFHLTPKQEWRRHDREAFALSDETVRGKRAFIIQSFGTDDMRGVFCPFDGDSFRVKLKNASGPFKDVSVSTLGITYNEGTYNWRVRFVTGQDVEIHEKDVPSYLHLLGETVDEKIWGTILFASSLVDASVQDITLVATMLPYMRQDEKFEPRMLLGPAAFARQMKTAGINRIITCDVHSNSGMQNACSGAGIRFDGLQAKCLLAAEAIKDIPKDAPVVVLAPDVGSTKRAAPAFQETVERLLAKEWGHQVTTGFAMVRKVRTGDTKSEILNIVEDPNLPIRGSYVLCQDDILATGGTLCAVEKAVSDRCGTLHAVCYTHGLFTGDAEKNLEKVNRLVGTMTVDPWRIEGTKARDKITMVDLSPVFGRAIRETHMRGSINALLTDLERA